MVDDNSSDKTGELVHSFAKTNAHITCIIRKKDPSLGKSVGEGIKKAAGDIIIGMDADFNHNPKTIPILLDEIKRADLVIASRFLKHGGMEETKRFIATLLFNTLLRVFGFPNTDNTSGFYAVKKDIVESIGINRIYYGYGDYHLRLVYFTHKRGYSIKHVPTYYSKRRFGRSKSHLLSMGIFYMQEAIRLALIKK